MSKRKPPSSPVDLIGMMIDHAVYQSFAQFTQTEAWTPAVNIYQVGRHLHVCVDLAGVDKRQIDVRIEPGRLTISGVRHAPEPSEIQRGGPDVQMKIHALEIDYGRFSRTIQVPRTVDLDGVHSEYRQGLLWITMPLKR